MSIIFIDVIFELAYKYFGESDSKMIEETLKCNFLTFLMSFKANLDKEMSAKYPFLRLIFCHI